MRSRIILALSLAILVSGCDKKAEGQTVAIVNGEEITAAELNAELDNAKIPPGVSKDQARNRVLQQMIDRRLLAQQAKKDGLDKSPEFLNRQRRMNEDLLINMFASRQIDTTKLPSEPEIQRYQASRPEMFANREQWNLEQLRFTMPTDEKVKAKLEAAKSLEEVATALGEAGITFNRQKNRLDTAVIPHDLYGRLLTVPPGEPFIIPVGNLAIASVVVSREPAAITGDQARPVAVAAMRRAQAAKLMQDRLKSLRTGAKIDYKPGFAPQTNPQAKK
ncbi:MAG TPA: SurA N-terminal domain-containing protein [Sphingomicrobium sp.]|nr:SurA N-terminal domain-containing protein [Sphingomicrobium sp.]